MGCGASNTKGSIHPKVEEPAEPDERTQGFLPDQQIAWIIDDATPGLKVASPNKKTKQTIKLVQGGQGSEVPYEE